MNENIDHAHIRAYFEGGCLCIRDGVLRKQDASIPDRDAHRFYMENCLCTRHPDSRRFSEERDVG